MCYFKINSSLISEGDWLCPTTKLRVVFWVEILFTRNTSSHQFVVYVDDMNSHLEPFENEVNLCLHAGWGYDAAGSESYTQNQVINIIVALLSVAFDDPSAAEPELKTQRNEIQ